MSGHSTDYNFQFLQVSLLSILLTTTLSICLYKMTSNEDIMAMLNSLKMQADRNNEELKNQVMKRIDGLEEKVDNADRKSRRKKILEMV